jgi:hypothetical protein
MANKQLHIIYELSINTLEFSTQLEHALQTTQYSSISITNKKPKTPSIEIITKIQNLNPKLHIIPYYSLKYHQKKTLLDTTREFVNYLKTLYKMEIKETLLVSGVPKPKYDSLLILKNLKDLGISDQIPKIAISYNPFLSSMDLELENTRIQEKIQTGLISSIYFQIGVDLEIIREAVYKLRELDTNVKIYLSLINPSISRLSQLRYRPWKGVYLPEQYLSSTKNANIINQSIYNLANEIQLGIIQGD